MKAVKVLYCCPTKDFSSPLPLLLVMVEVHLAVLAVLLLAVVLKGVCLLILLLVVLQVLHAAVNATFKVVIRH